MFQLESFGGTSSTDPVDHGDDMANIFGPPLENIAETNGTTNHNSSQQNGNGKKSKKLLRQNSNSCYKASMNSIMPKPFA